VVILNHAAIQQHDRGKRFLLAGVHPVGRQESRREVVLGSPKERRSPGHAWPWLHLLRRVGKLT